MPGIPRQAVKRSLPILGTNAPAKDIVNLPKTCAWSTAMHGAGANYYLGRIANDEGKEQPVEGIKRFLGKSEVCPFWRGSTDTAVAK